MIDTPKPLSKAAQDRMAYVCRTKFLLMNGFKHMPFGPSLRVFDGVPTVALHRLQNPRGSKWSE